MRKLGGVELDWPEEARDPRNWPLPDLSYLDDEQDKRNFHERRNVLDLYLTTDTLVADISDRYSMTRGEIWRMARRAFLALDDGRPVGYLACLRHRRFKAYRRKKAPTSGKGSAGSFEAFLCGAPALRQWLDDRILGRRPVGGTVVRGSASSPLWKAFRLACEEHGIDVENDYPFTNADKGMEAIRRYATQLANRNFVAGAKVKFGEKSERMAKLSGTAGSRKRAGVPYACVEFDGHCMDTSLVVAVTDAAGDQQYLTITRVWLLIVIDQRSRAVLGYSLSLTHKSYTMDDVLECFARAFEPWKPKPVPEGTNPYLPGAGLPSGVIERCAWRAFDAVRMDNAWAHHSEWLQSRLLQCGVLEVITNIPASSRSNADVERVFGTIEAELGHRLPSTTGTGPTDPRRTDPEAKAKALELTFEDLELLVDVTIANYNATTHTALGQRSPLAYLQYRLDKHPDLIRHTPDRTIEGLALFERDYQVTVRGSRKIGHRPYVNFQGARYAVPMPTGDASCIGRAATLRVDTNDIRFGKLFIDGKHVGEVEVEPRFMGHKHGIKVRREINRLIKKGKIGAKSHRGVEELIAHILRREGHTAKGRGRALKITTAAITTDTPKEPLVRPKKRAGIGPGQPGWITLDPGAKR